MYKYSLLLMASISVLNADISDFTLQKQPNTKVKYFVKIGSYSNSQNAQKNLQNSKYAKKILFLEKYYSVVGNEYESKEDAQKSLQQIKKQYKDAYIIELYKKSHIAPVEKASPSELQQAISQYRNGQYEEALAGFDRVLIDDENNLDANIYYAMTLYKLGIYDEAKKRIKGILKRDLSKDQESKLSTLLDRIEAKTKRNFFTTTFSIGAGYDDNINLNTDKPETKYGGKILLNDTNKTRSAYGLATLFISHRYHGESVDIVSSLYSYNEFAHTYSENNMNFLNLSTALIKNIDDWSFSLPLGANGAYLDGNAVAYNLYTNPTVSYRVSNTLKTYFETSYLDNTTKFASDRDYTVRGVHVGLHHIKDRLKTALRVGFEGVKQKRDLRFDVEKDVLSASLFEKYFIFSRSFVALSASYMRDKYKKMDQAMGYKREDKIWDAGVLAGHQVGKNSLVELKYMHRRDKSNINTYSYDKNNYTVEYKISF